jgi:hypothetical protein
MSSFMFQESFSSPKYHILTHPHTETERGNKGIAVTPVLLSLDEGQDFLESSQMTLFLSLTKTRSCGHLQPCKRLEKQNSGISHHCVKENGRKKSKQVGGQPPALLDKLEKEM